MFHFIVVPARSKPFVEDFDTCVFNSEKARSIVGGWIEVVHVSCLPSSKKIIDLEPLRLIVDDEGLLKDKPYNKVASVLYGGTIVGDTFICCSDFNRETCEVDLFPLSPTVTEVVYDAVLKMYLSMNMFTERLFLG